MDIQTDEADRQAATASQLVVKCNPSNAVFSAPEWDSPMSVRPASASLYNENRAGQAPPQSRPQSRRRRCLSWGFSGLLAAAHLFQSALPARAQDPGSAQLGSMQPVPASPTGPNQEYMLQNGDESGSASFPRTIFPQINYPLYPNEPNTAGGAGVKGRIGVQAGTTVGQSQPFTNFDLSPYLFQDNLYLFGEGRIALGNDGKTGGSLGTGARYFMPGVNSIIGGSGWLDIDATRGSTFHQWGINAEFLSEFLDIRGNYYSPYGTISKVTNTQLEAGSQQFIDRPLVDVLPGEAQGTYLSFQRRIFSATALQGFDTLFTIPMPGEFAQALNLETSAGFYGYEASDGSVPQTYGWRLRFDIDLFDRLSHMFLEVNNDKTFKTNVAFMADINYWNKLEHRPRLGHSQYNRLADWVRRNRTVVALESSALGPQELAVNPNTSRAYVFYQVRQTDEVNHGGNGTLGNPFQNLQDAINATGTSDPTRPSDFVAFVQGNSVIQNGVNIGPGLNGLQVIGEQTDPSIGINVQGLATPITLPNVTAQPFTAPTIQNVGGVNAVTVQSNNNQFSGFNIFNITGGDALFIDNAVSGGTFQSLNINNVSGGNGVHLNNNTGVFSFNDVVLTDIEGDAVIIEGGTARAQFSGVSSITNNGVIYPNHGYAVNLIDAGGSVNMQSVIINDTGGSGIRVYGTTPGSSTVDATFGNTTLVNTVVPAASGGEISNGAVYVRNHAGSVSFTGPLAINGIDSAIGGDAFVVEALQASGSVFAQDSVTITGRRGRGIYVVNSADSGIAGNPPNNVRFQQNVSINGLGTGYTGTAAAVEFNSYSGGLIFNDGLSINGSNGHGVDITTLGVGTPVGVGRGLFQASNVIINNARGVSFNVHDVDKADFQVTTNTMTIGNRGTAASVLDFGKGINVRNFLGTAAFQGSTVVNNELNSQAIGINIEDNNDLVNQIYGSVGFQQASVNNQLGAGSYGVRVVNNLNDVAGISFTRLDVTSTNATAVSFQDNAKVAVSSGQLNATTARAVEIFTSAGLTDLQQHATTFTSINATGSDYGIFVDRSLGQFTVSGSSNVGGTGGTISGMSVAGAHFSDTQSATLQYMLLSGNRRGVEAIRLLDSDDISTNPLLLILGSTISGSSQEGIYAEDVSDIRVVDTVINSNGVGGTGLTAQEQIEIFITSNIGTVDVLFNNNNIVDNLTATVGGGTDMIYIHNAPGAATTNELNLTMINNGSPGSSANVNSITANRTSGNAAINVEWSGGAVDATFNNNQINTLNAGGQIGLNLSTNSTSTNINYTNNALNASGNNAIGIQGIFQQAATFNASNNQVFDDNGNLISGSGFQFGGSFSTGMNLQFLSTGNTITVNNNLMQFTQLGSQGIVFQRLTGNNDTTVAIGGNSIYRPDPINTVTTPPTVGIYLQTILGNITLINSGDNFVEFNSIPGLSFYDFLMSNPNAANGTSISVNGSLRP